jgi:propanediol utilization protein
MLTKSVHLAEVLFSWPLRGFSQIKLSKIEAFHLGMTELLH